MTLDIVFGGLARMIGIFMIFAIVGPLAFSALMLLIAAGFGAPKLMLAFLNLAELPSIVTTAAWVFGIALMLFAVPPSAITGLIFVLATVGTGANAIWIAWLAAAVAIAATIVLGLFVVTPESSAVLLPKVQTAVQALTLFSKLTVLAIPPVTLCWWLAKPLHRG
jgi:hypothetical protein